MLPPCQRCGSPVVPSDSRHPKYPDLATWKCAGCGAGPMWLAADIEDATARGDAAPCPECGGRRFVRAQTLCGELTVPCSRCNPTGE